MKTILTIAFRNVLRNKRRAVLTAITIAVGLAAFIVTDSMYAGISSSAFDNIVSLTDSSLSVRTETYEKKKNALPIDYGLRNYEAIRDYLLSQKAVRGVSKRIKFFAGISDYDERLPVMGIAIDPSSESNVFRLRDYITHGRFLSNAGNEIILGEKLANDFGLSVGDYLLLTANTAHDAQNADDFEIVGLYTTPAPALNSDTIYISYATAEEFLDAPGLVTELNAHVHWPKGEPFEHYASRVNEIDGTLHNNFSNIASIPVRKAAEDFLAFREADQGSAYMIYAIVLLIAAVGVINTVLMSVYERIREVGILRALGFDGNEILLMFMFEGFFIGLLGALLGIVLSAALNAYLVYVGFDLSAIMGDLGQTGFAVGGSMIYGEWDIPAYILSSVMGIVLSFTASIIPARKAALMHVTRALRFQ